VQKSLSISIEDAEVSALLGAGSVCDKARIRAAGAPHASAWLEAPACKTLGLHLTSAEFSTAVKLRVGAPLLAKDSWCLRCDQVLDRSAVHACMCKGGGDAVVRHNSLRDESFFRCVAAGFEAERETPGLLADDPRRRPGDVFLPSWRGGPTALDFAVTCPLQATVRQEAAESQLAAAMSYEATKLADRDTARRCTQHGLRLIPMVVETLGGWGPSAQQMFKAIAKASAERTGAPESIEISCLYQSLGVRLQRANARAILTRTLGCEYNTALANTSNSEAALVLSTAANAT
jgi:hypothetical protein